MEKEQLERLLNTACEIIIDMEEPYVNLYGADTEMVSRIDALFNEIKYSDKIDPDMEAQDWDTFEDKKI